MFKVFVLNLLLSIFSLSWLFSANYVPKDYSYLLQKSRLESSLLSMHFDLYKGYVNNTNLLLSQLEELAKQQKFKDYAFTALKRRLSWEFDGMRLHEYYFDNLGGDGKINLSSTIYKKIVQSFNSLEEWKKDFIATGLTRGIGWVILYEDSASKRLFNVWINEHDVGHLAGGMPLIVMDVFEHAYLTQFGLNRAAYIDTFFQELNWPVVEERLELK